MWLYARIESYYNLKEMITHLPMSFSRFIWDSWLLRLLLALLVLSCSSIYFLTGWFGFIEFRLANPNSKSLKSFLETIAKESNYRKAGST